jgi:hypothetical protein
LIIHSVFLGPGYPLSARFRIKRADLGTRYGLRSSDCPFRWVKNDEYCAGDAPCLAVDVQLWDLLHSGLGMRVDTFKCRKCGEIEQNQFHEDTKKRLLELRLCFYCDFWQTKVGRCRESNQAVIDGKVYSISPDQPAGYQGFLGFGGSRHEIQFFDGRTVVSHNLWFNGEIPPHWRDELPDNARFVQRSNKTQSGHDSFTGEP